MTTDRSNQGSLAATSVKRRYRRAMKAVRQAYLEGGELSTRLAVPSPEECERMIAGTLPVTLDALLLAVLRQNEFYLSEACSLAEHDLEENPCSLLRGFQVGSNPFRDERLARSLRRVVAARMPAESTAD